jgi:hypothetical protein
MNKYKILKNRAIKCIKIPMIILTFFLIFGCDPIFYDQYKIDNKSDFEIKVYYKSYYDFDTTIIIPAKSLKDFFNVGGNIGYAKDYKEEFLSIYFDSISLNVNDSIRITKDYLIRENWEFSETGNGGGVANYKLILDNSDIENR